MEKNENNNKNKLNLKIEKSDIINLKVLKKAI